MGKGKEISMSLNMQGNWKGNLKNDEFKVKPLEGDSIFFDYKNGVVTKAYF